MKYFILLPSLLLQVILCNAQDYSGTYSLNTTSGQSSLVLKKNESGIYSGSLSINNAVFKIVGQVENGLLTGRIGEEGSAQIFAAQIQNQELTLTTAKSDLYGNLDLATAQVIVFKKSSGDIFGATEKRGNVIINNTVLSYDQIKEIADRYGVEPVAGNYWYDKISGLYGVSGYPAYGFMYPGHNFGVLSRNASSGNTGVIINGRELAQVEWAVWSYMLGYYIQPGSYWLDAQGNAGYEGSDVPVVNLFMAAQQNLYSGKGSAGDNFWSTRFSAGNSNQDNTQGYVSVPGYGPVGYGF